MKQMYKFFVAACLIFSYAAAQGQAGYPRAAFQWRCTDGNTQLNFNPATTDPLVFDDIPYAGDYTLVVVYKPLVDNEATVWNLTFADSVSHMLTTERIISNNTSIRYTDYTDGRPMIHTLRQSAPEIDNPFIQLSVGDSRIKVAEVLYFDHRLSNTALRCVQSALAIRYGITLGPVDYIGGDGARLWNHQCDGARYHHRIIGLGNDAVSGDRQFVSHSEMEGGLVTIAADTLMPRTFLLLGDNDKEPVFEPFEGWLQGSDCEMLSRRWRIQATGATDRRYTLTFDTRRLSRPADSLVLLVNHDIYLPDNTTADAVTFRNVLFPTDSSVFTLARGTLLWQIGRPHGAKGPGNISIEDDVRQSAPNTRYSIYPNPTTGRFTLEVSGAQQVQVTIYNLQGKVEATYNDSGRDTYRFKGTLPSGNAYYATVTTENGSQTLKLVVK